MPIQTEIRLLGTAHEPAEPSRHRLQLIGIKEQRAIDKSQGYAPRWPRYIAHRGIAPLDQQLSWQWCQRRAARSTGDWTKSGKKQVEPEAGQGDKRPVQRPETPMDGTEDWVQDLVVQTGLWRWQELIELMSATVQN